jgi:protein regulator of cytokinesis 1
VNQLCATFVQVDWLYAELGMEPPEPDELLSPIPPLNFLPDHRYNPAASSSSALSVSALGDPFFESTPTPLPPLPRSRSRTPLSFDLHGHSESDYRRIFRNFVTRLEEADDETVSRLQAQVLQPQRQSHGSGQSFGAPIGMEGIEPTPGLFSWAENLRISLEDTKKRREAHIQAMYDQLECLWRRMGASDEDMDAFVEAHRGSTEETIREYEEELERMLELKRERMGAFVASAREEIIKLWDELMVGEEERGCFAPFADGMLSISERLHF